ncbi:MAG: AAA family ATPase, partial [Algiphilus sp.]
MVALAGSKLDVNPSTPDVAAATTPARINWEIERQGLAIPDAAWQQQKPVITISGPPGSGKSTLLLQWRKHWQAAGRRVVWS